MLIISWAIALIVIMIAGMWAGRALESSRQFTGADRSYGAIGVGCMLAAVQIGGMSMIGAAQNGYNIGIAGAWYSVSGCCYFFVMIACVKALYKKMPGVSLTQYLGMRYGKINARIYVVIYLVYAVLYVPIQLQTCVGVLQIVVPQLSYNVVALIALFLCVMYTGYAGMKGANTVGKIICLGTYAVLIVFIFVATGQLGGISGVLDALPASYSDPFQMKTTDILAYAFGNVFTYFGFQSFMQPMLAAKDVKTARRGLWIGWALSAPICIFTAFIGMIARVGAGDSLGDGTTAYAWAIQEYSNTIFAGITLALTFMIIAATLAGMFMGVSLFVHYLWVDLKPDTSDKTLLKVDRYSTYIYALITIIPSLMIPTDNITALFVNLGFCVLVPISFSLIGGVFWDRVTKQAAMASHLAGIGCAIIWVATGLVDVLSPTYPVAVVTWGVGIIATLMSKPAAAPAQKE